MVTGSHHRTALIPGLLALWILAGIPVSAKERTGEDARPRMAPRKVLTHFDTNKDGRIDGKEADALRKAFAGDLKDQLAPFDIDRDGRLDDREIAAIRMKASPSAGGLPERKPTKKNRGPVSEAPVK